MEYFKNVMLKLYETGDAGSLLPVVATVLQARAAQQRPACGLARSQGARWAGP